MLQGSWVDESFDFTLKEKLWETDSQPTVRPLNRNTQGTAHCKGHGCLHRSPFKYTYTRVLKRLSGFSSVLPGQLPTHVTIFLPFKLALTQLRIPSLKQLSPSALMQRNVCLWNSQQLLSVPFRMFSFNSNICFQKIQKIPEKYKQKNYL